MGILSVSNPYLQSSSTAGSQDFGGAHEETLHFLVRLP